MQTLAMAEIDYHLRFTQLGVGFALLGIIYFVSVSIYRLTLDPLAKFPGPKLWAVSPFPAVRYLLNGKLYFQLKQFHEKYGPVVRVSPNELTFNTAEAIEDIYGYRVGKPNMNKDPIHVGSVEVIPGATNLTMADDPTHSRQRRAVAYAFSSKALLEQEPILRSHIAKLVSNLRSSAQNKTAVNLVNWLSFTSFDIIGDLAFGAPFGCLDEGEGGESAKWVELIYDSIKSGALEQATRRVATAGTLLQKFLLWCTPNIIRERRRRHLMNTTAKTRVRLDNQTDHHDFLWYILKQREKKNEVSDDEVIMNAALFITAGSDTTATLLAGLVNYLLRHMRCYDLLIAEVRDKLKSESDLVIENLNKLPYLNACIEEGLRLFPPAPTLFLRTVPKGGSMIAGHFVPGGTAVSVSTYAAGRNPLNFKEPEKFLPERWIDSSYDSDVKKASQAFSYGPRGCVGKHVAYNEMKLILANLLWNFDFKLDAEDAAYYLWDTDINMANLKAWMTWEKPPLVVKLTDVRQ